MEKKGEKETQWQQPRQPQQQQPATSNNSNNNNIITAIWVNASAKYLLYAIFTNIYIRYNVLKWVI